MEIIYSTANKGGFLLLLLLGDLEFLHDECNLSWILLKNHTTPDEKSVITFHNIVSLPLAYCLLSFCHSRDCMK